MRITILKDKKISETEVLELQRQFDDLWDNFDIQYFVHERDYVFYPTFTDNDGDKRPTDAFLRQETNWVKDKYGKWGTDHVVILIHEDNWLSPTIWGTNYSNIYHGYQVHYCMFHATNPANQVGVFYHEIAHSVDALIKTETGISVESFLNLNDWDRDVVHGQGYPYEYIRYNENLEAIDYVESYLKQAYANRKARYDKEVGVYNRIIQLLQTMVVLLRQQLNRKNGVNL